MTRPIIFLSDYGLDDEFVGVCHGVIARLAPGVSVSAAQAELDAHNAALERDNPEGKAMAEAGFRSIVVPLHADHVAAVRPVLLLVQAGALLLLTIGAVNLVNLLLIRASARRRERAVRQTLGATRGRIVAEVLIGLLDGDPQSFLSVEPNWEPEPDEFGANSNANAIERFTMADLLTFAFDL